jgi:RNA polymerase sigma-70 factor (ECF subfamily)
VWVNADSLKCWEIGTRAARVADEAAVYASGLVSEIPQQTDEQLVDGARSGDRAALERLLERHERQVYRFGLKMCRDPEAAKDVLQETLIAAARTVKDFRGASSPSTWLYAIARSFCIKQRRRSRYAPEHEESIDAAGTGREVLEIADPGRAPDDALSGRQVERALEQAIAELDPMYREILLLRDVEGLSAAEVAEAVGVSVDAVKSRLHRARVAVREKVAPVLSGEPESPITEACPEVVSLFSRHLEGEISAPVCEEMERHLAGCRRCSERCATLQQTLTSCARTPLPDVPAPVQQDVRRALRQFLQRTA